MLCVTRSHNLRPSGNSMAGPRSTNTLRAEVASFVPAQRMMRCYPNDSH